MAGIWKCAFFILALFSHEAVGCTFEFVPSDCAYNVYCHAKFSMPLEIDELIKTITCPHNVSVDYNGQHFYGLRLIITNTSNFGEFILPFINADYSYYGTVNNILVLIDMSRNHLEQYPVSLPEMPNLKMLNLSYNILDTAKLFSTEQLNSLEHLDLSHNAIKYIDVNQEMHVFSNLRSLNLSHNHLAAITDGIFELLKHLETLDLSNNNITVIDHSSFEGLKSVVILSLSHNMIGDVNNSLFRFSNLQELYFDNNKLRNIFPRDFEKLVNLKKLDLSSNMISDIDKTSFSSMVSLHQLLLQHNSLENIDKNTFLSTSDLTVINLSYNVLKTVPKYLFRNQNITHFSISGNIMEGPIDKGNFDGLTRVPELDISYQGLTELMDYAFFRMDALTTLLLNNNKIRVISNHSFSTLKNLRLLDLSNNMVISLDFDKLDLISLQILSMRNNFITEVKHEHFHGPDSLQVLDLSNNSISKLEPNSFQSMETIKNFKILHNPLRGVLLRGTFNGLQMVPDLDLSCSLLTMIENGSFSSMSQMRDLNISQSTINELQFNAFSNTGAIRLIDLSHNKLKEFSVNSTHLENLTTLYLSYNFILHISSNFFKGMSLLNKIDLGYNLIRDIEIGAFADQLNLRYLDLSCNFNLTFNILVLNHTRHLDKLFLTGLKLDHLNLKNAGVLPLTELYLSSAAISNASTLQLTAMEDLTNLVLSNNAIRQLELGALNHLTSLRSLDLSFNKISFIEPGSFKDNMFLSTLNISHNSLSVISYGMLRGLTFLNVLDISFNNITNLRRGTFYDVQNLKVLIADHNKITDVSEEFVGINLDLLSIGDNPLPCEKIANWKYNALINVTALRIDEYNDENIEGITCNFDRHMPEIRKSSGHSPGRTNEQFNSIESNPSIPKQRLEQFPGNSEIVSLLTSILHKIENPNNSQDKHQTQLNNVTFELLDETNKANLFLERILKAVVGMGSASQSQSPIRGDVTVAKINETTGRDNGTVGNLISDVLEIKRELLYLENILSDVNSKISRSKKLESVASNEASHEAIHRNTVNGSIFTEICVALILLILVCGILYVFYRNKFNMSSVRSLSTRHITESIDNAIL